MYGMRWGGGVGEEGVSCNYCITVTSNWKHILLKFFANLNIAVITSHQQGCLIEGHYN